MQVIKYNKNEMWLMMDQEKQKCRLRDLRENHNLTQREMALEFNMSQTGYSKYETGENDIPTSILIKAAMFFDTSIDYLVGLTDEKRPYIRSLNWR